MSTARKRLNYDGKDTSSGVAKALAAGDDAKRIPIEIDDGLPQFETMSVTKLLEYRAHLAKLKETVKRQSAALETHVYEKHGDIGECNECRGGWTKSTCYYTFEPQVLQICSACYARNHPNEPFHTHEKRSVFYFFLYDYAQRKRVNRLEFSAFPTEEELHAAIEKLRGEKMKVYAGSHKIKVPGSLRSAMLYKDGYLADLTIVKRRPFQ